MPSGPGFVGLSADAWSAANKETTYGTAVGPSGASEFFLFLSETLKANRPLIPVPNITAAFLDVNQKFKGATVVDGDLEFACTYETMENLLLHCFGQITGAASGTSGSFSRNFDLTSKGRWRSATSPSLTVHVSRGIVGSGNTNPTVFSYSGCIVDSFQFSCGRDQPLKLRMTLFGRNEVIAVSSQAQVYPTSPVINFTQCTPTWGGTKIPITEFSLTVRRNIDRDRFFAGDLLTNEPPMGQYEVECTATTEWDNENRVGTTTMRADYIAQTARELALSFTSDNTIVGTSNFYNWNLSLPQAIIGAFPVNVAGRGRVLVPMTFKGWDSDVTAVPHEVRLFTRNARNFADN
jgi:hypothetical protein